ncbi:purine and uridine phosphorylase, partial [Delitschia confertaspora ATCC 74209]
MSDPNNYVVGWICAITTEYVAAQVFLDEKHERPESVSRNNNNNYTLGRIGEHNVVIAVLPDGEYGISSAAGVARDMVNSFPNVRIGLMVGIGGGAPTRKHDIRLGDIVVSAPRDGKGGVLQYDFGKTIQDQSFQQTGFLNQPPTALRAAVGGLRAKYEIDGHQLNKAIHCILEKKPRLRKKYGKPSPESDRLYLPTITHPVLYEANCAEVCSDSLSHLILRNERAEDEDNPAIHYGLVASANQLMKDAMIRDKLANENDVLCFEMEAAGLMNHFPCLVIRGICDYSDTHKNKEWQGYAAMVAAAYAKDILYQIPPIKVDVEKKISELLSSVKTDVHNMRHQQRQDRIDSWLSPPDPLTNYNKALQQREENTGVWLLQQTAFENWKTQQNSFLWLRGIPGCGKTILTSTVIEDCEKNNLVETLLYFYFDFNDTSKQTLENMLRSLISQLYQKKEDNQKYLDILFSTHGDGHHQPSCKSLCEVFYQMIESIKEVWIVLDALDECRTRAGSLTEGLLKWAKELLNSEQRNVHLLVTSRPEQDIHMELKYLARNKDDIVFIQSELIEHDINTYIHAKVKQGNGLKRWRQQPEVQDNIEAQLMQKANGMFRWVACQIGALEKCLDLRTLERVLESLPKDLDETYERIIESIPHEVKQTTTRILQFLTYSERPLTIAEAVDAIAVDLEAEPYFESRYRMPEPEEILLYCSSLVIRVPRLGHSDEKGNKQAELQLAHFSVKEYLTSNRLNSIISQDLQETSARASIAKVCLGYLMHFNQRLPPDNIRADFPLAEYSAMFWLDHAAAAQKEECGLTDWIKRFSYDQKTAYHICYNLYRPDQYIRQGKYYDKPAPALYYAACGNLWKFIPALLNNGADVNALGGRYGNALQAAS